jgi:RHS repeat-associated protein
MDAYTYPTGVGGAGTTVVTDPHGNETLYDYDGGVLSAVTAGYGSSAPSTTTFTRTTRTLLPESVTDPDEHTTTLRWNTTGDLLSETVPAVGTTTTSYNAFGEPLTSTDPMGIKTTFAYDTEGNLLTKTVTGVGGSPVETTTDTYGGSFPGEVTQVTDPAGHVTNFTYDTDGDVTSVTTHPSTGAADTTAYVYDLLGRVLCEASPDATATGVTCPAAGHPRVADTTTWTYDADGEVTSSTDPQGKTTSSSYDADGNTTKVTDPLGNVTTTTYDADDRVTSATDGYGTSSAATTSYGYDIAPGTAPCSSSVSGATYCSTTTDPDGLVATDYYDAKNEVIESVEPNAGTTTDTYDAAGNLLTETTPGGSATYGYDADNRLTSITYSDPASGFSAAPNVTYSYNADGERTQMTDGTGTTSDTYDPLDRLSSTTNGAGSEVSYGYNLDNQVTSITYPGNHTVTQGYDGAGRETSVTDWLGHTTNFSYDPDGNLTTEGYPNSTSATYAYNATDEVTQVTAKKGSTTLASFSYTRNADGLVATESDTGVPAPTSQTYSYDPLTWLASTSTGSYGYDPSGNLAKLSSGATLAYTSETEELKSLTHGSTTTTFTDNAQGDRTASTTAGVPSTYSWDQAGRLVGYSSGGSRHSPTVTQVAAGAKHTCALESTGHIFCWGTNSEGQLGNGTTTKSSTPVEVVGVGGTGDLATVTSIAAGGDHTCALSAAKHVYCWGTDYYGQLGNGSTTNSSTPLEVEGVTGLGDLGTVSAISAGYDHTCALSTTKSVDCWGTDYYGQLGNGTSAPAASETPVAVIGVGGTGNLGTVSAISAGGWHTCVLTASKTVDCWGWDWKGTVGNGRTTPIGTPVEVEGVGGSGYLATVTAISAGAYQSCGLQSTGHLSCWDRNEFGQLGDGTASVTTPQATPAEVEGVGGTGDLATVSAVAAGGYQTCALTSTGHAYCWGRNNATGTSTPQTTPVEVEGITGSGSLATVSAIVGGGYQACALTSAKDLYCWGTNSTGELGDGTTTNSTTPVEVVGLGSSGPPSVTASYEYNGDGLRMSKTVGGTKESFTWDVNTASGNPNLLVDGTDDYVYGPTGLPLEQIKGTTVLYYVRDQLGSTRVLTSSSGAIVATYTYDAYGSLVGSTGSATNPFGFSGAYSDSESGLLYLVHRYYDPTTGQFLSVDPAVSLTQAPYSYANDDPVNEDDPLGLGCGIFAVVCNAATRAWNDTGGKVVHYVATHTIGLCLNLSAGAGPYGTVSGCIALSGGRPTLVGTAGGGGASPTASATLGLLLSNANNPSDLRGPFAGGGGSADLGLSVGDEGAVGTSSCNQTIWENQITAGVGSDIPFVPFELHGDATYTWTWSP